MPQFKRVSAAPLASPPPDSAGEATAGVTVLVADPDPVLRRSLVAALARLEHRVVAEVAELADATRAARKLNPALVILGQPSPERALLDRARSIRATTHAAVVALSPIPDVTWVRHARAAGVDALLGRPPREGDLIAAVELALGRREEEHYLRGEVHALKERVEAASLIQRAKEVLMQRDGITDSEAYEKLRRQAERTRKPLKSVAEAVLVAASVAA